MGAFIIKFLIGLLIAGIGVLMTWKTSWIMSILGPIGFAERIFGGGGTRFFYKLVGVAVIFVGIIVATDLFDRIFGGFILGLFGLS